MSIEIKNKIKSYIGYRNCYTILEIGAHHGEDTIELYEVFQAPMIVAIEPYPQAYEKLSETISNLKPNAIITKQAAISNITGKSIFNVANNTLSGSLKEPKLHLQVYPDVKFEEKIIVDTIKLDDFWSDSRINLIHLDVQGAEDLVIEGGKRVFRNCVEYLYTEYSNFELYEGAMTKQKILDALGDGWEEVAVLWNWTADGDVLLRNRRLTNANI
jgi:FkbM family methyltransferase